jgi:hypothetical protein
MSAARIAVEDRADAALEWYRKRAGINGESLSLAELLPIPVDQIAFALGLTIDDDLEEIPNDDPNLRTAGFIDCGSGRIVIARGVPLEQRRFTIAHEIGHRVLHPSDSLHRDRRVKEVGVIRPRIFDPRERDANAFAAQLTMPRQLVVPMYGQRYGGLLELAKLNEDIHAAFAHELAGTTATEIRRRDVVWFASLVANAAFYAGTSFEPLTKAFGVSTGAMATQLQKLGLVR